MYLPLAYVEKYSILTDLYCSKEYSDCEPQILLEMISDNRWGYSDYEGPNKERYSYTLEMMRNKYFAMHRISACFAVAGFSGVWKYNKVVYEPDQEFSKALIGTKTLRVYPEMLKHIPFNTFYLDFSKNALFEYEGFFVNVKVYSDGTIKIMTLPAEKNYSNIPVNENESNNVPSAYMDSFVLKQSDYNTDNGMLYFDYDLNKDFIMTSDSYRTQWFIGGVSYYREFILQFLMYLSSKEPDIVESVDTINTYRPSNTLKNKYSEIRKWDVGCRYGDKIRLYEKRNTMRYEVANIEGQNSKRPHIRKAHWERYHIGKGRSKIVTKWIEPVFVNGNSEDIIAIIHGVTNKDADCSSGEELIKKYLKSKNILFYKEYYIREIRRRFDFKIEIADKIMFIEFDGEQHFKSINRWKGKKGYLERRAADSEKNLYCKTNEIPLLRIRFDQAYLIPDMIDDFIKNTAKYNDYLNTYLSNEAYYEICE